MHENKTLLFFVIFFLREEINIKIYRFVLDLQFFFWEMFWRKLIILIPDLYITV